MICTCVYYSRTADKKDLQGLARAMKMSKEGLIPVAVSQLNGYTKANSDCYKHGFEIDLPDKGLVLFVQGESWAMRKLRYNKKVLLPWFPESGIDFEDLVEF